MKRVLLLSPHVQEGYALQELLAPRGIVLLRAFSLEEAKRALAQGPSAYLLRGTEEEAAAFRSCCPKLPGILLREPLPPEVLVEKVFSLLDEEAADSPLLRWGDLTLNTQRQEVQVKGKTLPLLREEYLLLLTLWEQRGQPLSAAQLGDRIFRRFPADAEGQVASLARSLGRKVQAAGGELPEDLWRGLKF